MKLLLLIAAFSPIAVSNIPYTMTYEAVRTVFENQVVYAYTSSEDETDDTPFITAAGTQTRNGIVANNCHPFGTEVVIEGETYVVEDMMNERYGCHVWDVWHQTKDEAREWGKKIINVVKK